mgnify:CR=1 FL=1
MTTLKANVTFISNDNNLSANEKLNAIKAEVQQTYYSENEYDDAVYGKSLDVNEYDYDILDDIQLRNTNLDELETTEGIDLDLLLTVRALHNWIETPSQDMLDTALDMNDCLSTVWNGRNKQKFVLLKTYSNGDKLYANEEWNWIENAVQDCDRPDWLAESEEKQEEISKQYKEIKARKMLWKQLREDRTKYKNYYASYEKLLPVDKQRAMELKKLWDKYYKSYLHYSKLQDKLSEIDNKITQEVKKQQAEYILSLFVKFQQLAPSSIVDKLLREDVKSYYKTFGYNRTVNYLTKAIRRAKQLA